MNAFGSLYHQIGPTPAIILAAALVLRPLAAALAAVVIGRCLEKDLAFLALKLIFEKKSINGAARLIGALRNVGVEKRNLKHRRP